MSLDLASDIPVFVGGEFAVDVLLWPDTSQERAIRALYDGPFQGVSQGEQVEVLSFAPSITTAAVDLEGFKQGDVLRVLPAPALGVAGGDFKAVKPQPDGAGLAVVELHKS